LGNILEKETLANGVLADWVPAPGRNQ